VVGFSKVDDFGDELLGDDDIGRLEVEMDYFLADQEPHREHDVEQQVELGPHRDTATSQLEESVQRLAAQILHQKATAEPCLFTSPEVLWQEVAAAPVHARHHLLLMLELLPQSSLQPSLQRLNSHQLLNPLLLTSVGGEVEGAHEGHHCLCQVDEAGSAFSDGLRHPVAYLHLHCVIHKIFNLPLSRPHHFQRVFILTMQSLRKVEKVVPNPPRTRLPHQRRKQCFNSSLHSIFNDYILHQHPQLHFLRFESGLALLELRSFLRIIEVSICV
jgi:hypothetical protein